MGKKSHRKSAKSSGPEERARAVAGDGSSKSAKARPSWYATHGRDLRFLAIFFVIIGIYYFLTTTSAVANGFFPWYLRLNADASAKVLNALGYDDVSVRDRAIGSSQWRMQIERGCDGVDPSALFVAAVLASPVAFRRKLFAAVVGTLLLLGLNVVRIVTLYFTGIYFKDFFDTMHLDVWQAAFIILALFFWAVWATRFAAPRTRHADATV